MPDAAALRVLDPASPVPVTGQTPAVGLVGATLGARRGGLALALYLAAGLVLPIYADGHHGWGVVWSASGGYLIGFVVAAWAIGRLAERIADRRVRQAFLAFIAGQLIMGGIIKAAGGAIVLPSAWPLARRWEGPRG